MAEVLGFIADKMGIVFGVLFGLIAALAVIRSVIKVRKGKTIYRAPVGVFKDLPGSITGMNDYKEDKRL